MAVYAVTYLYVDDVDSITAIRPTHRAWLAERLAAGELLASGPMVDSPNALLIWRASAVEELNELLNQDPFDQAGLIAQRTVAEWNPVFGPFSGE